MNYDVIYLIASIEVKFRKLQNILIIHSFIHIYLFINNIWYLMKIIIISDFLSEIHSMFVSIPPHEVCSPYLISIYQKSNCLQLSKTLRG